MYEKHCNPNGKGITRNHTVFRGNKYELKDILDGKVEGYPFFKLKTRLFNEAMKEAEETGTPLPENIQKVIDFMDETGGSLEEYVKLNQDYSSLDDISLLREYYKQTKPHLNAEEINFILNDQFEYDEEVDEEKTIKRKKLALKEQVASARAYLDGQKSKY